MRGNITALPPPASLSTPLRDAEEYAAVNDFCGKFFKRSFVVVPFLRSRLTRPHVNSTQILGGFGDPFYCFSLQI